jgi:plastocyanin
VEVYLDGYQPEALTVTAGDTVTWVNRSPVPHEMAFTGDPTGGGADDTAPVLLKSPVSLTVTRPGSYPYRCNWHGFYGLLTVRPRGD